VTTPGLGNADVGHLFVKAWMYTPVYSPNCTSNLPSQVHRNTICSWTPCAPADLTYKLSILARFNIRLWKINLKLYLTVFESRILLGNKSLLEYLKNDSSSSCTVRSTISGFVSSGPEMCWRSLSTVWERISCVDLAILLVMNVIEGQLPQDCSEEGVVGLVLMLRADDCDAWFDEGGEAGVGLARVRHV
jgi:hypothetical protein